MPAEHLQLVAAVLIVALGTAVQASLGFGLAMIASPLLLLVDARFVPGPMIACALVLSLWVAWRERHALDFRHFGAAIAGRALGTPLAALVMGSLSAAAFDLLFGLLVLLAVGVSLVHPRLQPTRGSVFAATIASGFMGTLSGIGGPPLALVYQNSSGASLRAKLSLLFIIGTVMSLAALIVIGRFGAEELRLSGVALVGVALGVPCSRMHVAHVDRHAARPWLLGLCAVSAAGVLVRALLA